ncbi:hypothetical protein [Spiroplasma endosymbiont of Polydrusus pterygomalis]|uniref:hypothetical protein n=1 Tax=Spiroplasma endosymbiont of Polydrusus pterygomalis TaxID=3139327 RepID=UPI003CCAEC0F
MKEAKKDLETLLKVELSDVITNCDLGEILDNTEQTILNRVRELNYNLDINQVKIQEDSINDTTAIIELTDYGVYNGDPMKVTFIIDKQEEIKGEIQNKAPANFNGNSDSAREKENNYATKQDSSGDNSVISNTNPVESKIPNSENQRYDVPAYGSCLFWSVATEYLLQVRNSNQEFKNRFIKLFGKENLKYLQLIQNLLKQYNLENNRDLNQLLYEDQTAINLVTNVFRNHVVDYIERNLDTISNHGSELTFRNLIQENNEIDVNYLERMRENNSWGGTPEIMAMSNLLNVNISVNNDSPYQPINQN